MAEIHVRAKRSVPVWLWIVIVLLVIAAAVIIVMRNKNKTTAERTTAATFIQPEKPLSCYLL